MQSDNLAIEVRADPLENLLHDNENDSAASAADDERPPMKQSYMLHLVMLFPMVVFIWDAYETAVDHWIPDKDVKDKTGRVIVPKWEHAFFFQLLVLVVVGGTSAVLVYFLEREWCVKTVRGLTSASREVSPSRRANAEATARSNANVVR